MNSDRSVPVWDIAIRIFHWSLVITFAVAYLTGEGDEQEFIHSYAGYIIGGLIAFRFIWGFVGTRYARFSSFIFGPGATLGYLAGLARGKVRHYLGHNPAGAAMVFMLLFSITATVYTGLEAYAAEGKGPLAQNSASVIAPAMADEHEENGDADEFWEEVHEFFANLSLLLIALHIAGVFFSSRLEHQNLVKAMLTGRKKAD